MSKRKALPGEDAYSSDDSIETIRNSHVSDMLSSNSFASEKKRARLNMSDLTLRGDLSLTVSSRHNQQIRYTEENLQRCGLIKKISLRNFKCHAAFDHTFGLNINFILGRNGSKPKGFI